MLVIVLWTVALLAFLVTRLVGAGKLELQRAAYLSASAAAEAAADGAIHEAAFHLLEDTTERWPVPGVYHVAVGRSEVNIRIRNLAGLVNPNRASLDLIQALLQQAGVDERRAGAIAAAILDWRTPGVVARPNGAKAAQYRAAGLNYAPPGTPLQSVAELSDVLGMTSEILERLRPHLSVYVQDAPDPAFADEVVMTALRNAGEADGVGEAPNGALTVSITADALGPGGARFCRHAVVITAPVHVVAWDRQHDE